MRMCLLFFLLLVPINISAMACTAGQYLNNDGECDNCPAPDLDGQGHYCKNDTLHDCPTPFSTTDGGGKSDIADCLIKIDKCIDNYNVAAPVYISCDSWDNGKCSTSGIYTYIPQRGKYIATDNAPRDRKAYITPGDSNSTHLFGLNSFAEPGYHLELLSVFSDSSAPASIISPDSFEIVCVPDTLPCSYFRTFTDYENDEEPFDISNTTHVAAFNTTLGAPPEDEEILSSHTISGTNCPIGSDHNNTHAQWDEIQNRWDVSACTCVNSTAHELQDKNCFGFGTQNADPSVVVHTIQENVVYQTALDDTSSYCIRCKPDVGTTEVYFVNGENFVGNKVTACTNAVTSSDSQHRLRGYYRHPTQSNYCGGTNAWNNPTNLSSNPCARVACVVVGTTTNELLPIGESNCVYGGGTQICDGANGDYCINLDSVGGLSLNGWQSLL